jgi:hypothetical protein
MGSRKFAIIAKIGRHRRWIARCSNDRSVRRSGYHGCVFSQNRRKLRQRLASTAMHTVSRGNASALALCGLSALWLTGCAAGPPEDAASAPAPQNVAVAAESASVPAAPSPTPEVTQSEATLTPAQRQARAKETATQADQQAQQALRAQCAELRSEIREQQLDEQQAPNSSVSEQIVQAKEAHADQRIQHLQDQYESLDCTSVVGPQSRTRVAPVVAAPHGLTPSGAQGVPGVP